MHESTGRVATSASDKDIRTAVLQVANFAPVEDDSCLRFASVTFSNKLPVLLTIKIADGNANITLNCEKMVFTSMLMKKIKEAISSLS